jgi:DNA-binding response OmpR family regulator
MSAPAPDLGSSDDARLTILVAEDEVLLRMPLAEYLRDAGYRVLEAASAEEGKALLGANAAVDLVFTDINMPGEDDGFVLVDWVRGNHPGIALLLTSGSINAAAKLDLFEGLDMMLKPYDFASVLRKIEALLARERSAGAGGP